MKAHFSALLLLVLLFPARVFSQGTTCANATPFCTAVGTPFTYVNSTTGSENTVRCLLSTPGPNWFFVKTTTPGTYVFSITQSTTPGGSPNIDVDFIAFGPYSSPQCSFGSGGGGLTNDCSSVGTPWGEVEDCSYCWDPTETMTLRPTSSCQVYMVLVTNYSRTAGYITFTQTSGPSTDCNITNVNWTPPSPLCSNAGPIVLDSLLDGTSTGTWSGTGVSGNTFNPATAGVGSFNITYTVNGGTCPSTESHDISVVAPAEPVFSGLGPYCVGDSPAALPGTSSNGISGTWSPSSITTASAGSTTYIFTPSAGQCADSATMTITVQSSGLVPSFTPLGPYCVGETPAGLPATSDNGVSGTWNPPTISTADTGTTVYTFTPGVSCAISTTMSIVVTSSFTPVFDPMGPYCAGESAPSLPATSNNGVTGTWSPSAISTDNPGTFDYTFTPTSSLCAQPTTLSITVDAQVNPSFDAIPPFCAGTTAPVLNSISPIGVSGTWNPPVIDNSNSSSYVFTPDPGWCSLSQTLDVTVLPSSIPDFAQIPPFCSETTPPVLDNISPNGIAGTWSPAVVDNQNSGTYVFTPDTGSCALQQTMEISVIPLTQPVFQAVEPFCAGSFQPVLKDTSVNGISGVWTPETVDNTVTATYTFTPYSGQCAAPASMEVLVYPIPGDGEIVVPNIFTPNGDNFNDVLGITGIANFPGSSLIVFNRWGKIVYKSSDYDCDQATDGTISGNHCWDGTNAACGVYYYVLTVSYEQYKECSEGDVEYHGVFTIMR